VIDRPGGARYALNVRMLERSAWSVLLLGVLLAGVFVFAAAPEAPSVKPEPVPLEEYPVYDRVVQDKFLSARVTLVVVNRFTVTRLIPNEQPVNLAFFEDKQFFGGALPRDLVADFLGKSGKPSRLEARFNFGVPVRFVSDDMLEGPEVHLAPMPAGYGRAAPAQVPPTTVGILEFSRVGVTPRGDQALVYVGDDRADGSGAGFLVWLRRRAQAWDILDTEVLWVASPER
jgi:hypothetical protein